MHAKQPSHEPEQPSPSRAPLPITREEPRVDGLPAVTLHVPLPEVIRAVLAVLVIWFLATTLARVQEVVLILLLAILLATAIGPLVDRLRQGRLTHGMGVLVVYGAIMLAIGLPLYILIPSVVAQATTLGQRLPAYLQSLQQYATRLQPLALREAVLSALASATQSMSAPAAPQGQQIVQYGATAAHTIFLFVTIFVLAFYWLVERESIKVGLMRALPPGPARSLDSIWTEVEVRLGGWVRGQIILMICIGVMSGVAYGIVGLPSAVLLGVVAGVVEIVPMVGPFLAFAPAVVIAFTIDPTKGVITLCCAAVIQQFESNILVPRVMGHSVGISPLTVLLGILVGGALYGLPGTFMAVPIAASLQVILSHLVWSDENRP